MKKGFMDALYREMELRKDYLGDNTVGTIYFGGGTPSVLKPYEIDNLLLAIGYLFEVDVDVEITIEVNPDDVDEVWIQELKRTRVNRISIGVQSFHNEDLVYLNRLHDPKQIFNALKLIQDAGYENVSVDLIYGMPSQTPKRWESCLQQYFELDLPHLSAYALTVEPKTTLDYLIRKKKTEPVDERKITEHFRILQEMTSDNGYIHYEISNFAREGFYSRHNSIYWLGGHYLGLGPSAHSFNGHSRQWNISNVTQYIKDQDSGQEISETEYLTEQQRYNEYVMTSLRTTWGCDLEHIGNVFGEDYRKHCLRQATAFLDEGKLEKKGNKLFLTNYGKLFADGIAAAMFWG